MKKNRLRKFLVFILIFAWLFTGWPQVFNFPPEIQEAYAFSSGPLTAGTVTQAGVTGCTNNASTWSTTASVYANNDSTVTTYGSTTNWDAGETTDEVRLANFGFNITGTVTGITVEILGWESLSGSANYTDVILFTTEGTEVGADKATGALPTSDPGSTYQTFGGAADTWSAGLTAAQVSASTFGVVICFTAGSANSQVTLDHVRMTITYTNSAPTLSVSQPDGTGDTVTVGDAYNVTYTSADSDNVVTTAFFYDTNNSGLDGTAISGACATAAEGTDATCSWDTTGVSPGTYYVYGITNDGVNSQVSAYSPGQITINAAPVVSVSVNDGTVTYGTMMAGASKTTIDLTDTQTLTNDGNVLETFNIKGQNTACPWTLAATAGTDQYTHEFCKKTDVSCASPPTNYTALTTAYQTLYTSVAAAGTKQLDLRITVPTTSTCSIQQSADVTIQAVQQ
ncbi:MAG: hypothetical protein A2860_02525 [Candidatus Levybacteria bacterium RIFCSPHIGHO2_01_FULL_37_33]|nr:MAG: hypothetical protein A2860_02525 [Candidatus Levybacteria bacterium RIFCSPHIGHO2_01_FULL_37_33]OGH29600.1 MAG: hypothetical protein A3F30_02725 [Candidatus Levybacteria bacterium RIFCSPHIGHO2_12_FULL_37_12]OGH33232.1 MAG: hypothetical protein A2953_00795 [Candidatus Levybacteria bacterium RIFCSPLOWO2_01_FULL_36_54]